MIVRANKEIINFLLYSKHADQYSSYKESSKTAIYILVDYYDWLEYMNTNIVASQLDLINKYDFYISIYNKARKIINKTKYRLTVADFNDIVQSKNGIERKDLELLIQGYEYFVKDLEKVQQFFLDRYEWNNNTYPKLIIPFSFGLNRLCMSHFDITSTYDEDGLPIIKCSKGEIRDSCRRPKISALGNDCLLATCTYNNEFTGDNISLPKEWLIKCDSIYKNKSDGITRKIRDINTAYCNYRYVGVKDNFYFNKSTGSTFLLNYPFPIREVNSLREDLEGNVANFKPHAEPIIFDLENLCDGF